MSPTEARGGGVASYPLSDALGSTRLVTDAIGTTAGATQYDAYGAVRAQTGQQLRLGYTGQQQDGESGLLYLRGRFYDPRTGRFLSQDSGGGGSYAYANNNPTRFVDPSGHIAQPICTNICKLPTQEILDSGCGWEDCLPGLARITNIIFRITGVTPVLVSHSPATVMCADPCGGGGSRPFPSLPCGLGSCSPSVDDIINDLIDQFIEAACSGSIDCAVVLSMQRDTIKACVLAGAGCDRIHVPTQSASFWDVFDCLANTVTEILSVLGLAAGAAGAAPIVIGVGIAAGVGGAVGIARTC